MDDINYKIITLDYPIDLGDGKQLTSIKMSRRLKVGHLRKVPSEFIEYAMESDDNSKKKKEKKIDYIKLIPFLAVLCNLSTETFDEIDFADLGKIAKELEGLFQKELSQPTGVS